MKQSEKTFQILDALDRQEISTQRQLANQSGISLGQVNYILKSLLGKGLVKIGNFKKNPHKIGYIYLLTPKGIEEKSRLAVRFVMAKLREYDHLRERLTERLNFIEQKGKKRIIFVGPPMVKEFINSIIKDKTMKLVLTGHCKNWQELKNFGQDIFDIVLLFDGSSEGINKIAEALKIPNEKLLSLW